MFTPSQQYELKINRNPFKLNKHQKNITESDTNKNKLFSFKKQKLLSSSTSKLRNSTHAKTLRQQSFDHIKDIQQVKQQFFQFKNHKNKFLSKLQQKNTDYETSLSKKQTSDNIKATIQIINYSTHEFKFPLTNSKKLNKIENYGNKQILIKQSKVIKQVTSIKNLSIFKTQKLRDLSSSKQVRKRSLQIVLKPLKRKQKSGIYPDFGMNKMLGKLYQSTRYEYQLQDGYDNQEANFTFGKKESNKLV